MGCVSGKTKADSFLANAEDKKNIGSKLPNNVAN